MNFKTKPLNMIIIDNLKDIYMPVYRKFRLLKKYKTRENG